MKKAAMIGGLQSTSKNVRIAILFGIVEALNDTGMLHADNIAYEINEITPIDVDTLNQMIDNRSIHNNSVKSHRGYKTKDDVILSICNDLNPYFDVAYADKEHTNIGYNGCKEFIKQQHSKTEG
jgi:hypothetical protein